MIDFILTALYIVWGAGVFALTVRYIIGIKQKQISPTINHMALLVWPVLLPSRHGRKFLWSIVLA